MAGHCGLVLIEQSEHLDLIRNLNSAQMTGMRFRLGGRTCPVRLQQDQGITDQAGQRFNVVFASILRTKVQSDSRY